MAEPKALKAWEDITPLARNEWICWTTSVKKVETRKSHVKRLIEDLVKGKRRHVVGRGVRTDKRIIKGRKLLLSAFYGLPLTSLEAVETFEVAGISWRERK